MTLEPWRQVTWQAWSQVLLDSYAKLLGSELLPREGSIVAQSQALFEAPVVVVSHGAERDPLLNYGNRRALELWEMDVETLVGTPSRLTAEPLHRNERAELLARTTAAGYVSDYRGIRISRTGRRFRIKNAVVWNLANAAGDYVGLGATLADSK